MLRVLRVLEFQFQQAVDVQGHGVILRVHVLGCCVMARWTCDAGVRGTCGGRCGVVRRGRRAVWRGCGVWLPAGGCPGRWCCPCVRFGLWPVVGVELARGVRGFQGWCRWGGVRGRWGVASFLCWWAVMSRAPGWGRGVRCGMVVLCCVVAFPLGGGGTVSRSGGVGCRLWFVLWWCGAAPRGLLIVLLVCFSTWPVRGWCGVGPGVPWGGVCGTGVSQPGGCGRVMLGGAGPPLGGSVGVGYCACGVRGSVGRGCLGVLWPRCGARGWCVAVCGWGVSFPRWEGGYVLGCGVGPW